MGAAKKHISDKTIRVVRRVFYNTPVMRWRLTSFVYDKVFNFAGTNLTKPIQFRGADFYVDPVDRSYVPSMVGGYYEKVELDIFNNIAKDAKIMFDVGANIGMYSVLAAKSNKSIRCHAFEPVVENILLLEKNLKLNKIQKQVTVVKSAVSNKTGFAVIHLSKKLSGTHSLSVDRGGSSRTIPTVSIDEYCKTNKITPDLVKIDVEGHEASVFNGMMKCLKTKPTILMEYIPELNKDMRVLIKLLGDIYEYCYVVDAVHGTTKKILLSEINHEKMYNIILSNNKSHVRAIEPFLAN